MKDYNLDTAKSYDENIKYYADKFDSLFENYKNLADEFIKLINGKRILDIGCGTGCALKYFKEKNLSPIGIDISEKMINLCHKKN